jgi:tRNA pseudouridine55 synthase
MTSRKSSILAAKAWGHRRFGHCGTLDPSATGVLPILLGAATRLSPYLAGGDKVYSFDLVLGITTDTDDLDGSATSFSDASGVTRERVEAVLAEFTGTFAQRAPVYSAVRVDGVRAYRSARRGAVPEMPCRTVSAREWSAGPVEQGRIRLRVEVSPGTYVRALARDIGAALGVGGAADSIVRERTGRFTLEDCSSTPGDPRSLLSMSDAMSDYPGVTLSADDRRRVLHGQPAAGGGQGVVRLLSEDGGLLAVGRAANGSIKPECVLEAP